MTLDNSTSTCSIVAKWLHVVWGIDISLDFSTSACFRPPSVKRISNSGCVPGYSPDILGLLPVWATALIALFGFGICLGVCVFVLFWTRRNLRKKQSYKIIEPESDNVEICSIYDSDEEHDRNEADLFFQTHQQHLSEKKPLKSGGKRVDPTTTYS